MKIFVVAENGDSDTEDGPPPLPEKHAGDNRISLDAAPAPPSRQPVAPAKTPRKSKVGFFDRWMPRLSVSHQSSPLLQGSRLGSDSDLASPK